MSEKSIDETIPGGEYIVNGQKVNANGEPIQEQPKQLSKMSKAELVAEAERLNVSVTPDSMTNKQIIEAIEASQE